MLRVLIADLPSLLATMLCHRKGEQSTGATWQFSSIERKMFLVFDAINVNWTTINTRDRELKQKWEKNRDLAEFLRKISLGDCNHWFKEFLEHWEEMPGRPLSYPEVPEQGEEEVENL